MADEDDPDDEDAEGGEESEDGGDGGSGGGKKKLFIIIGVVLLLVVGGLAGAYFTGLLDPLIEMVMGPSEDAVEMEGEQADLAGVYYEIPELLVNLNSSDRKSTFLKIRISLEIESALDIPKVEQIMPRIIDNFQIYLRELRLEDLKGAAGMYRLREELLTRVSAAAAPIRIKDVLFREMLVQ
jgi:flagellar protein FliL